jgi:hypothetical protein
MIFAGTVEPMNRLNKKNVAAFQKTMKPYLASPECAGNTRRLDRRRAIAHRYCARRRDLQATRKWARANGHEVSDRGRISKSVVQPTKRRSK